MVSSHTLESCSHAFQSCTSIMHFNHALQSSIMHFNHQSCTSCINHALQCDRAFVNTNVSNAPPLSLFLDNKIYIFDRKTYMRTAIMKGHSSYITHIDFSRNSKYLQSNSGDYELMFWDVRNGKQITSASSLRDKEWETWTCTIGWPVQGNNDDNYDNDALCCGALTLCGTLGLSFVAFLWGTLGLPFGAHSFLPFLLTRSSLSCSRSSSSFSRFPSSPVFLLLPFSFQAFGHRKPTGRTSIQWTVPRTKRCWPRPTTLAK